MVIQSPTIRGSRWLLTALLLLSAEYVVGQAAETVLYSFCSLANCADGSAPHGRLTFDSSGNLYGTTIGGGAYGSGTVFELTLSKGEWTESALHSFCVNGIRDCPDGSAPYAGVVFDKAGNLYGTTQAGGNNGEGTVFQLAPPLEDGGSWTETVVWSFGATGDGRQPFSDLVLDSAGRLYGTTSSGGAYGAGTVFRLVPQGGGQWSEEILSSFGPGSSNGYNPRAGVTLNTAGNVYGTTEEGGSKGLGYGVVYKLSPSSQLPWPETVLFRFNSTTGVNPVSPVTLDSLGNLYGTVSASDVFQLRPRAHNPETSIRLSGPPGPLVPYAGVLIHGDTLYGTTDGGGTQNSGTVYQVYGNTVTVLYSFCSETSCTDGSEPDAAVIARNGSLYGTATRGGINREGGVVYQISMAKQNSAKPSRKHR